MGYQLIESLSGCSHTTEEFRTKAEALRELSLSVKPFAKLYKGTGYKKIGTVRQGSIVYHHPVFGIDYSIRLMKI